MKHMLSIIEIYNQLVKMYFKWIVPSKMNILSFNHPLHVSLRIWIVSKESCFLSKKKEGNGKCLDTNILWKDMRIIYD